MPSWQGTITPWNYPRTRSPIVCQRKCPGRPGFTNIGTAESHWWVCGACRRPTEEWLRGQGDTMLNKFVGGPLDGMVYTSSSLLEDASLAHLVLGYVYTSEVAHSPTTAATARVWELSATVDTTNTDAQNGVHKMTAPQETQESPVAEAPAPPAEPVDVSGIVNRRKSLQLSRTPVAAQAGMTVAQLARIENGGKRTTPEEVAQVTAALDALEAQQPVAATPTPEGGAPDPA